MTESTPHGADPTTGPGMRPTTEPGLGSTTAPGLEPPAAHRIETARVRRSPRYGIFFALGAALGIVAALVLTYAFDGTDDPSVATTVQYSTGQVFGFLLLWCIPIGVALAGVVALILDRRLSRRTREVRVDHERVDHERVDHERVDHERVDPHAAP